MTEMVARMMRVIQQRMPDLPDAHAEVLACALLEEMREPTPAMSSQGEQVEIMHSWGTSNCWGPREFTDAESCAAIWRTMIKTARFGSKD